MNTNFPVKESGYFDIRSSMVDGRCFLAGFKHLLSSPVALERKSGYTGSESASVLVIVLLIVFGLISLTLYFANSMTMELRVSDNRACSMAADQAIEGAARYVTTILTYYATNGVVPSPYEFPCAAVPVGNDMNQKQFAHYWLIGRDTNSPPNSLTEPFFGLVDEASKLDLNATWVTADVLSSNLPVTGMTYDFAQAIVDWRSTNATVNDSMEYAQWNYTAKHSSFETVGELHLVYGATQDTLAGEDINRNGVLDANEKDLNGNGQVDPGIMEYVTVYSRQPNTHSDGSAMTNVNTRADIQNLLTTQFGSSRASAIMNNVGFTTGGGGGGGGGGTTPSFPSLLRFYMQSGMTADEFAQIYNNITVTNAAYTVGRVNINTAPVAVLACLPGMNLSLAQTAVQYRNSNPSALGSIAWIVDALGANNRQALTALAAGDYITTRSFQFTADIAALGPYGRGYRRVRFVFDISSGTPRIVYRQDLSRLGWALGRDVRNTWVTSME